VLTLLYNVSRYRYCKGVEKEMLAERWHCFREQLSLDESTITQARREENLCVKKTAQEKFYISATWTNHIASLGENSLIFCEFRRTLEPFNITELKEGINEPLRR
jgi:hypothetical protein